MHRLQSYYVKSLSSIATKQASYFSKTKATVYKYLMSLRLAWCILSIIDTNQTNLVIQRWSRWWWLSLLRLRLRPRRRHHRDRGLFPHHRPPQQPGPPPPSAWPRPPREAWPALREAGCTSRAPWRGWYAECWRYWCRRRSCSAADRAASPGSSVSARGLSQGRRRENQRLLGKLKKKKQASKIEPKMEHIYIQKQTPNTYALQHSTAVSTINIIYYV